MHIKTKKASPKPGEASLLIPCGPYGTRTRVSALRGPRPRPLDEWAKQAGRILTEAQMAVKPPVAPLLLCFSQSEYNSHASTELELLFNFGQLAECTHFVNSYLRFKSQLYINFWGHHLNSMENTAWQPFVLILIIVMKRLPAS